MLEELHFCCVKPNNKWNYLLHYYNFNGKNAKNFMFYMPHWHFFELESEKIPSMFAHQKFNEFCVQKSAQRGRRKPGWALIMCPTTWTAAAAEVPTVARCSCSDQRLNRLLAAS